MGLVGSYTDNCLSVAATGSEHTTYGLHQQRLLSNIGIKWDFVVLLIALSYFSPVNFN